MTYKSPLTMHGGSSILVLVVASLLFSVAPVAAQNGTTVGTLTLASTFNCVSVRASFTGDANANNSAAIQFRKTGDASWKNAYTPFVDRRATLGGTTNRYANQARGSIVGLTANTSYDVQVAWSDPDGVSSQPAIVTISTLSQSPPTGGSTITVTNNTSLSNALSTVNAGQTIHLTTGTYSPFTISRSGNSSAWIVIEGEAGTTVTGSGVNQNIAVKADFIVVKNLTLSASDFYGMTISGGSRNNIMIEDNTLQNVSARCADGPTTTHYGDAGISVDGGSSNIFILRNSIISTSLQACIQSPAFDGPGAGIDLTDCTTCIFDSNTVTGAFRDAISSDNSADATANVDISNNWVTNYVDDGLESKGDNVNVRIWGNYATSNQADTCIAGNTNTTTNQYGPLYIFRNVCRITGTLESGGGFIYKIGSSGSGPTFVFHNSMDASAAGSGWAAYEMSTPSGPYVVMNNIARTSASISEHAPAGTIFDYNLGTAGSSWAYLWNGTTTYSTFAAFRTATGQESHGFNSDPSFLDTALHINASSPAVNHGVILPNFNSLDSAWPYSGSAPDIGAYEIAGAPAAPTNLRIVR
jgi:hypothetical protein